MPLTNTIGINIVWIYQYFAQPPPPPHTKNILVPSQLHILQREKINFNVLRATGKDQTEPNKTEIQYSIAHKLRHNLQGNVRGKKILHVP